MTVLELERVLLAARLLGQRFELATKQRAGGFRGHPFRELDPAVDWLHHQEDALDFYLGLSAISDSAKFPPGRAKDSDVEFVHTLLIDVDPGNPKTRTSPADPNDPEDVAPEKIRAAREIADAIAKKLPEAVRIDSGRGQHLWLPHARIHVSEIRGRREALLLELARVHNRPGLAHVDTGVWNPSRLGRLPFTRNSKTNRLAALVENGGW